MAKLPFRIVGEIVSQKSKNERGSSFLNQPYKKGTSFGWKVRVLISNKKTHEIINLTGKVGI